jgi:hypothetical protein
MLFKHNSAPVLSFLLVYSCSAKGDHCWVRVKSISLIYILLVCNVNNDVRCEYQRTRLLGFREIHLLQNEDQEELQPTTTPGDQIISTILRNHDYNWFSTGYKPGAAKSADEYAKLDAEDESLARWKASLGIVPGSGQVVSGPKASLHQPIC